MLAYESNPDTLVLNTIRGIHALSFDATILIHLRRNNGGPACKDDDPVFPPCKLP